MGRLEVIPGVEIIYTPDDEIRLGHTWYEYEVLRDFLEKEQPDHFIEIGIHEGGLSYLLIPRASYRYVGVEIDRNLIRLEVQRIYSDYFPEARLIIGDCFNINFFMNIQELPNKVIYCDGGNKAKELEYYKPACKTGDIIMSHDFYDGVRKVRDVPNASGEVLPEDVKIFEEDETFERLDEEIFKETRIIGWRKCG